MIKKYNEILSDSAMRLITEAFNITETKYGTNWPDLDNGEFEGDTITYFWANPYMVVRCNFASASIKFATWFSRDKFKGETKIDPHAFTMEEDDNTRISNPIEVFNKVIYVYDEFSKEYDTGVVYFEGYTPRLKSIYAKLVKNEVFLSNMKSLGWVHDESSEDVHKFKRDYNETNS